MNPLVPPPSCIRACASMRFDQHEGRHVEASVLEYYEALLRPYGLDRGAGAIRFGKMNDFLSMGRVLLDALHASSSLGDDAMLLLVHDTPDALFPFRYEVLHTLSREFGTRGPTFALSEQGAAIVPIGLRVAQRSLAEGKVEEVVLLALEQSTLPYDGAPDEGDRGVAIHLTRRGHGSDRMLGTTARHLREPGGSVSALLDELADELGAAPDSAWLLPRTESHSRLAAACPERRLSLCGSDPVLFWADLLEFRRARREQEIALILGPDDMLHAAAFAFDGVRAG